MQGVTNFEEYASLSRKWNELKRVLQSIKSSSEQEAKSKEEESDGNEFEDDDESKGDERNDDGETNLSGISGLDSDSEENDNNKEERDQTKNVGESSTKNPGADVFVKRYPVQPSDFTQETYKRKTAKVASLQTYSITYFEHDYRYRAQNTSDCIYLQIPPTELKCVSHNCNSYVCPSMDDNFITYMNQYNQHNHLRRPRAKFN